MTYRLMLIVDEPPAGLLPALQSQQKHVWQSPEDGVLSTTLVPDVQACLDQPGQWLLESGGERRIIRRAVETRGTANEVYILPKVLEGVDYRLKLEASETNRRARRYVQLVAGPDGQRLSPISHGYKNGSHYAVRFREEALATVRHRFASLERLIIDRLQINTDASVPTVVTTRVHYFAGREIEPAEVVQDHPELDLAGWEDVLQALQAQLECMATEAEPCAGHFFRQEQ